jgi:hypothetical protein
MTGTMDDNNHDEKHVVVDESSQASETVLRRRLLRKTDLLVLPGLCTYKSKLPSPMVTECKI